MQFLFIGAAHIDYKAICTKKLIIASSNPVLLSKTIGGVALNMARNMHKLGAPAAILSVIGDDSEGVWLRGQLELLGISARLLFTYEGLATASYTAVLDHDGGLHIGLVNDEIYSHMSSERLSACFALLASFAYLVLDTNLPHEVLHEIICRGISAGSRIVINPVSVVKAEKLPSDLSGVFLLVCNEKEAATIFGLTSFSAEDALGPQAPVNLVVSRGKEGLCWYEAGRFIFSMPAERLLESDIKDVTGAGDALTTGILWGLSRGWSSTESAAFGQKLASATIKTLASVVD